MRAPSPALRRYLLLELPGWMLAAGVAWWLVESAGWDPRLVAGVLALWVAKDLALFPWLRRAYEPGDPDPAAALVGRTARVSQPLDPRGYVRLGTETWRAELDKGAGPLPEGREVRVLGMRGLTLRVEATSAEGPEKS